MAQLTLAEVAAVTGGELAAGSDDRVVDHVAPLESAGPGDLSFVANARYLPYLQHCRAAALLVPPALRGALPEGMAHVVVDDPHIALYRVLLRLYPAEPGPAGVHPTAVVDATVRLGEGVAVEAYAVIGPGARLGARCRVGAHAVIGRDCSLGDDCVIHPHATLYPEVTLGDRCMVHSGARLGKEGYGFVWHDGGHRRVPQIGRCVLESDVEVGCNSTIDRGSVGDTVVGAGTKIDNLVHLGHNARVGKHVLLVAQVGVAGSSTIGDGAVLGGQVGIAGHLTVGAGARVAAQAGVIGDVPPGETYSGYPARPHREALRAQGALFRLPDLIRRVRDLEKAVLQPVQSQRREP